MIPERKEPQVNATLCFGEEQSQLIEKAVDELSLSGRTIVLDSGHQAYTSYCLRAMIDELARVSGQDKKADPVHVRRGKQEREIIVASLNKSIKNLNLSSSHSRSAVKTKEIWIFENSQSSSAEAIIFAANIIKQFKSAGISMIVTGRSNGAGLANVDRLAELTKGAPFIFDLPEPEEADQLFKQAKLMGNGSEYAALMKEVGLPVEKNTKAAILAFSEVQELESDLEMHQGYQDLKAPLSKEEGMVDEKLFSVGGKKLIYIGGSTALAFLLAGLPLIIDIDRVFDRISSIDVSGLSEVFQSQEVIENSKQVVDFVSVNKSNNSELTDEELVTESLVLPSAISPKSDRPDPAVESTVSGEVQNGRITKLEDDIRLESNVKAGPVEPDASTDPIASSADLSKLQSNQLKEPDGSIDQLVESKWFVQHASFRAPQRAFLWKSNQRLDEELQVYSKGMNEPRFVVLSGPFESRDVGNQYLADNNIGNDKFFVKDDMLGERIYP
mgnify:CR=1 FL=1